MSIHKHFLIKNHGFYKEVKKSYFHMFVRPKWERGVARKLFLLPQAPLVIQISFLYRSEHFLYTAEEDFQKSVLPGVLVYIYDDIGTVCLFSTATKENLIARLPDELESSSWSHIKGLLVQFLSIQAQLFTSPQFARENNKHTKSIFKKKEKIFWPI